MIRIGAMVSGGGTNLQAVLDAIDAGKIDGQVVTVVSSKEGPVWYLSLQNKTDEDVLAVSSYPELKNIVNRAM